MNSNNIRIQHSNGQDTRSIEKVEDIQQKIN
jgi:hypothetical protein